MTKTKMSFFEYTITYWDTTDFNMKDAHGVVYAPSFEKAISNLEKYYDDINIISLQSIEPSNIYEFEKGTIGFILTVNKKGKCEK